jgi:ElaB/YqjD/DUF883 family membrane-anchored ribosome-binding protein
LSALGNVAGGIANQAGITDARNLINQYGSQAGANLNSAYTNAQNLGIANRTDLANINKNTATNMQNLYNQQVGYQAPYQQIGNQGATGLAASILLSASVSRQGREYMRYALALTVTRWR